MRTRRTFLSSLMVAAAVTLGASLSPSTVRADDAKPLRIHVISGSREYKSEESLKVFMPWLEKHYDIKWTASWGRDGIQDLPDIDKLPDADVMLIFTRRMKLPAEQMKLIRAHWKAGKPIVGLRTASHAFQKDDNETFDRKVMGGNYAGHFGGEDVKVSNEKPDHPVLKGVGPFTSKKLYKAGELGKDTVVLQTGDNGKAKHAVTWVNEYNGGRMFYSSLGVPQDFENEQFRRMLVNAIFWTAKRDVEKTKRDE